MREWQRNHQITLVILQGKKYAVDVGFGSQCPCEPILLRDHETIHNVPTSQGRLAYRNIAPNTDPNQRLWVYEIRDDSHSAWTAGYCFSELEFIPADFESMNFRTSFSKTSWFTYVRMLAKIILDDEENPIGMLSFSGHEVKRRLEGESEIVDSCKTEKERVDALKKWFGIELRGDEIRGIRNMVTELPAE